MAHPFVIKNGLIITNVSPNNVEINEFSKDGTLAGNSDSTVPTEKAVKTYVDYALTHHDWQSSVLDELNFVTSEPAAPTEGDRYINTTTGTSSETSQAVTATYIYQWDDIAGVWDETIPTEGTCVEVEDTNEVYMYLGGAWVGIGVFVRKIQSASAKTKVDTEESAGEEILRFDTNSVERMNIDSTGLISLAATARFGDLRLKDTNDSHILSVLWNENDTVSRILNLLLVGGNRSLTIEADSILNQDLSSDSTSVAFSLLTLANSGLHILDTNASHDLIITPGSDLTADRILTLITGDAARSITLSGNPTLDDWFDQAVKAASTPSFAGVTLGNSGLHILDTNASHDLIITPGSDLTADRILTITTGDSARTLTLEGDSLLNQDLTTDHAPQFTGINDQNDNEAIKITSTGSAVNEVTVINAATTNPPELQASGGDTNIDLKLSGKATGGVIVYKNAFVTCPDTGNYTCTTADLGKSLRFGSDSARSILLPSVGANEDGCRLTIIKPSGAGQLTIDAADSDYIDDSTAGGTIYTTDIGASLTIEYVHVATMWVIISGNKSWTTT